MRSLNSYIRTGLLRGMRWSNQPNYAFTIEAGTGDDLTRIIFDREDALRIRRDLSLYLKATAPKRRPR